MITLTPQAGEALRNIFQEQQVPAEAAVRVGVTTEGCEGSGTQFRYLLEIDAEAARPDDHHFETEGLKVRVDGASLPHVTGLQLDVVRDFGGVKFLFRNPNAGHSCGCGKTFSKDEKAAEGAGHGTGHGRHAH